MEPTMCKKYSVVTDTTFYVKLFQNNTVYPVRTLSALLIYCCVSVWTGLTHWGRDKMDAISQTTFWSAFSWKKNVWSPIEISLKFVPYWHYTSIGLDNGLAPLMRQAIIWTNDG